MDTAYHTAVSPGDTSPYMTIPVVERLRRRFCAHPAGTLLDVTVRGLADTVGCARGAISPALRRLEADGYIACLPTPEGTLVEVLKSDQWDDRFFAAGPRPPSEPPGGAPSDMASPSDESATGNDQSADRMLSASQSDQAADRLAVMDDHDSHDQQQQQHDARARVSMASDQGTRHPGCPDGVYPPVWQKVLAANPGYTAADFQHEMALVLERPSVTDEEAARQLVVGIRKKGEVVYARQPKEPIHGPRPGDTGDRRSHGTQSGTGGGDRRGGARGAAARGPIGRGEKRDKYGVGEAYRDRPADSDLPPFLRAARERARQAKGGARA